MKKMIAMLCMLLLIANSFALGAYALTASDPGPQSPSDEPIENTKLYRDRFMAQYDLSEDDIWQDVAEGVYYSWTYEELYYHRADDESIDWVIVKGTSGGGDDMGMYGIFGDYVVAEPSPSGRYGVIAPFPFLLGYGLYDVEQDRFFPIHTVWHNEKYVGLREAFLSVAPGRMIGDADNDGRLSILDATAIQRRLAKLDEEPDDDDFGYYGDRLIGDTSARYFSDYNRDGERTILDVTAIQRHLAHLD